MQSPGGSFVITLTEVALVYLPTFHTNVVALNPFVESEVPFESHNCRLEYNGGKIFAILIIDVDIGFLNMVN